MNDPTFKANYLNYVGGNEYAYDVAVYQSGTNADGTGQFVAALYNRRTGYWDAKATATGARNPRLASGYPNGQGWTIFETYLYGNCPLAIPNIHEWNPKLFDVGNWRNLQTGDTSRLIRNADCTENGFYYHQYTTPANEISKWLVNTSLY